jgi:type I restriction enzyme S subunit
MRQYKDSGTQGIGLIPQSWDSKQLGVFFSENRKANSYLESITALQFKYGEIIQKPNNGRDLSDKDKDLLSKYTVIEPGDVVVNGLNLNFDLKSLRIAIARENGIITSAYIVLRPRKGVNSEYYNYVLKALDFQKILHGMGEGIRLTLNYDELKKLNVPAPETAIQSAIVSYLDAKCGEIDSLIALQEQMIEKLKTYKQSVITEAVTKGLDPYAKLVPSGIDWIGEIPEGTKLVKLSMLTSKIGSGSTPRGGSSIYVKEGIKFLRSQNVYCEGFNLSDVAYITEEIDKEMSGTRVQVGDVLLNITGGSIGRCYYVDETLGRANVNQHVSILRPTKIQTKYLKYYLQSDCGQTQIDLLQTGGNREGLSAAALSQFLIVYPSRDDQNSIALYLDEKCAEIERLIALKQQKIESLKDYKKSVIYEAVTGKTIIE